MDRGIVIFLLGLPGAGKTRLANTLSQNSWVATIHSAVLDSTTRTETSRIDDLFRRFKNLIGTDHPISQDTFHDLYLQAMKDKRGNLLQALIEIEKHIPGVDSGKLGPETIIQGVIRPSTLKVLQDKLATTTSSAVLVDNDGMDFLAMDRPFFRTISNQAEYRFLYLKADPEFCLNNLLSNYSFLDRDWFEDIRSSLKLPACVSDRIEAQKYFEENPMVLATVRHAILNKLSDTAGELEKFVKTRSVETIELSQRDHTQSLLDVAKEKIGLSLKLIRQQPQALFIDLSSTLLDSRKDDLEVIDQVLQEYGCPPWTGGTSKKKDVTTSMRENFTNFFPEGKAKEAYEKYVTELVARIPRMALLDGAVELLEYCKTQHIKTVLLSNRDSKFVHEALVHHNLMKYFVDEETSKELIYTPDELGKTKPAPEMTTIPCKELGLDPHRVIGVGDAFADVGCAFSSDSVPVLFSAVIRQEIQADDVSNLARIFPYNPMRRITSLKAVKQFLEDSKVLTETERASQKAVKITYIGAHGKVGTRALQYITRLDVPQGMHVELLLMASGSKGSVERLTGFKADLEGALFAEGKGKNFTLTVTNNYNDAQGSTLVICSAAKWPTPEIKKQLDESSGRLAQSYVNADMIRDIAQKLQTVCPAAPLLLVTNQVDMMCNVARRAAPELTVFGVSGGVDSSRLKQAIYHQLGVEADGLMIGFHNSSMTPLVSSLTYQGQPLFPLLTRQVAFTNTSAQKLFSQDIETKKLDAIMKEVKGMGGAISKLQRTEAPPNIDTGASILPAMAISQFVAAYCFGVPHTQSYNVRITDQRVATHYGVPNNTDLSIPITFHQFGYEFDTHFILSEAEQQSMQSAQQKLYADLKLLETLRLQTPEQ